MTDRELLELAAKAAGMHFRIVETNIVEWGTANFSILEKPVANDLFWNPLTDDGDALRLAACLRLVLQPGTDEVLAIPYGTGSTSTWFITEAVVDRDVCAATRRAIVRAAAEIGKGI